MVILCCRFAVGLSGRPVPTYILKHLCRDIKKIGRVAQAILPEVLFFNEQFRDLDGIGGGTLAHLVTAAPQGHGIVIR